jgi:hypothetical protein
MEAQEGWIGIDENQPMPLYVAVPLAAERELIDTESIALIGPGQQARYEVYAEIATDDDLDYATIIRGVLFHGRELARPIESGEYTQTRLLLLKRKADMTPEEVQKLLKERAAILTKEEKAELKRRQANGDSTASHLTDMGSAALAKFVLDALKGPRGWWTIQREAEIATGDSLATYTKDVQHRWLEENLIGLKEGDQQSLADEHERWAAEF